MLFKPSAQRDDDGLVLSETRAQCDVYSNVCRFLVRLSLLFSLDPSPESGRGEDTHRVLTS